MIEENEVSVLKFIHVADMHMDRSFEGLGKIPQALSAKLNQENQTMFARIIDYAILEQVDFILFVGDTFHQPQISIQTQTFFIDQLKRAAEQNIPVIFSLGNHDYYQKERYWFAFPANVYLFEEETVQTFYIETKKQETIALSGFSYTHRWINEMKVSEFPRRSSKADYHIGLYHGQIKTGNDGNKYAPLVLSDLKLKGYDYWALGHIHQPTEVLSQPLTLYPGAPMGHTKKETTAKGILLIQLTGGIRPFYRWENVSNVEWHQETLDLAFAFETQELLEEITKQIISKNVKTPNKIILLSVTFQNITEKSSDEFRQKITNGELLEYLQQRIFQLSEERIWLYELDQEAKNETIQLPLGVQKELIDQLSARYVSEAFFEKRMQPLYQQNLLADRLPTTKKEREALVMRSKQKVFRDLGIKREEKP